MNKWVFFLITLIIICFIVPGRVISKEIIKLGTLAPEGSVWGKIFNRMDVALRRESENQLRFRFDFGRREKELVNRIEKGQLDAISLTAGLGEVLPETYVFQLPMLFSTYEELDYVKGKLTQRFSELFESKGYVFMGWGDIGFIYIFSKERIRTQTAIQKTRFWAWNIEPIAQAFVSKSGQEPIRLPVQDVLESLEKGTIQTIYASPLGCIAFGWHTQIKYMTDLRLAAGVGATIISKKRYDKLSDKHKRLLLKITKEYHKQLIVQIRKSNEESIDVLQQHGITVISVPHHERQQWLEVAKEVQDQFVERLYSKELLEKVRSLLEECDKNKQ